MSERREKIHTEHALPKARRCQLLEVARSTAYYQPTPVSAHDLALMRLIDEIHLQICSMAADGCATSWRFVVRWSTASEPSD